MERSNSEKLEFEVLSKTMMEQQPINIEERELDQQEEECIGEEGNGVYNMNKQMTQDIASLPPLPKNPCIFRVHERLRVSNLKAYTPQLVSIGPYHHGDPKLAAMEIHKKRYLNSILKRTNQDTVEPYIKAMMELEGRARDYYANPIVLDEDKFVEMMVLDGCFVIEFLYKASLSAEMNADDPIFQESWMRSFVMRDLVILIQNQLPFFVLSKLYDMIDPFPDIPFSSLMEGFIIGFIGGSIPISNSDNSSSSHTSSPDTPRESEGTKHFLDLVHKVCAPSAGYENLMMTSDDEKICFNIPCVVELQEAGVKFRPSGVSKEGGGGDSICIFDINFEDGQMNIPKIDVGTTTEIIFHNMIAYEQHTSDFVPKYFTSYTFFMHLLINSEKDVNQLCRCNIFEYKAGNDEGVARMFEEMGEGRVLQNFYLSKLCKDVNAHCDKGWNKLLARLRRDYFYSPWAGVSTFAAAFLILLTLIQTVVSLITLLG